MKPLILFAILFIPAGLVAQDAQTNPSRRRVALPPSVTRPAQPSAAATATARPATSKAAPVGLTGNVVLSWKGSMQGMVDLDVVLTGCGPRFQTEFIAVKAAEDGVPPPIYSIEAQVSRSGEDYHVAYTIGARVAIKTGQTMAGPKVAGATIEFRDVMTTGAILVKPGKPVELSKLGDRSLTFELSETE